jgi:signal transduction histidine kinase/FixJ family two-component response regulator
MPGSNARRPSARRSLVRRLVWLGRVAMVVLALMTAGSLGLFFTIRAVVSNQESRILHERGSELALLLDQSVETIRTLLPLAATLQSSGYSHSFHAVASSIATTKSNAVVVLGKKAGVFQTIAKVGSGTTSVLTTAVAVPLLERAAATPRIVGGVLASGRGRVLVIAAGAPKGRVIATTSPVMTTAAPPKPGTPFSDMNLALYAAASPSPKSLLVVSGAPPSGDVDRQFLSVGSDRWLLLASARQPLIGTVATWAPWFSLIAGLVAAVLVTAIVEGLGRRRSYALALVDERTATLEEALSERRHLQEAEQHAREEAEAANRSKNEFISRMSHELRTPLNAILGFGQLLEFEELTDKQRDSVEHILKGGNHLLALINEVLDIARIETGDLALSPEPVLVTELFADALSLIRPLATQRSIHLLGARDSRCDVYVLADRQRLQQVLLNLLSNGVKYNRAGGTVAVSCEQSTPTTLQLKVTDTGFGIPQEELGRLFTPFERLSAERTDIEGTGIGLALSRQLAEAMGGSLEVETKLGQGSTFWIELPLVEGPLDRYERLNSKRSITAPVVPTTGRQSILYIEDNLANLTLLQRIASERAGVEIIPAMQGRLGLELAQEHHPALILLDLHLPDINGDEVLQRLRDDPVTASIPVVIVSADATQGQIQRLLNAGAAAYVTKPFDVAELMQIIDAQIATRAQPAPRAET